MKIIDTERNGHKLSSAIIILLISLQKQNKKERDKYGRLSQLLFCKSGLLSAIFKLGKNSSQLPLLYPPQISKRSTHFLAIPALDGRLSE